MKSMRRRSRRKDGPAKGGRLERDALAVAVVALAARLWHLVEYSGLPWFRVLQMDAAYHAQWAGRLVREGWSDPQSFFRAPFYPYFLAVLQSLTGELLWTARVAQLLLGVATVVLTHRIARRLLPRAWALAAGTAAALLWPLIHHETELLLEPLLTFMTTLLLWLMIRSERPLSRRAAFGWGLLGGAALITRPNIALFLPVAALYAAWLGAGPVRGFVQALRGGGWRHAIWFLAGVMLVVAPVWAHNARRGDPGTLVAWQGGINFYLGNNPSANGWSAAAAGMRTDWQGGFQDALRIAGERSGRGLRPAEVSAFWTREGLRFWSESPGKAARLLGVKALLFWSAREIRNNEDPEFNRATLWSLKVLPVSFGLLAPLALLGLMRSVRGDARFRLLAAFIVLWFLSIIPFFVCARYRLPVAVLLPIPAAMAVRSMLGWLRERRYPAVIAGVTVVAGLFALLLPVRAGVAEGGHFQALINLGDAYMTAGDTAGAESAYRRGIELAPAYPNGYNNLGLALEKEGRLAEAERIYRLGLEHRPGHFMLRKNLGLVLEAQKRNAEAAEVYGALLAEAPDAWEIAMYLGRCEEQAGRPEAAREIYHRILTRQPQVVPARVRLAGIQAKAGDLAGARAVLDEGLRLSPGQPDLRRARDQLSSKEE